MHDIRWIRDNPDAFDRGLTRRGLQPESQKLLKLDEARRAAITAFEQAQARRNAASKEIGEAKRKKDEAAATALMAEVAQLKDRLPELEKASAAAEKELNDILAALPNIPLDEVPDGKDADGNVEHHRFGAPKTFSFKPKQHFELGEALGLMDFETAAKLSGARFVVLKGGLARLERALGQFMLDVHTGEHGYTEVNPPILVRDDAMFGTAQLPKFAEDQFATSREMTRDEVEERYAVARAEFREFMAQEQAFADREGRRLKLNDVEDRMNQIYRSVDRAIIAERKRESLWLIPTAEVPLTNLVRESIVDEAQLPMRLTACTPCFRAEAGAAGKDTRGMIRQHQFTKVELVSITTPEQAMDEHERMTSSAEEILRRLELPYRVMTLCTGDMGFASQKTYDIEVWLPGQDTYREISSCSVCGDFQARRMNARYRSKGGGPRFVHTLNGSGVAVGRALIAVMENYQNEDGSITVPEALQGYMGGMKRIEKAR
ncbi:MAG: serine--tRNA ligase [Pseudorhodoplanes sp.]|nr:serine--tRNA ligase [Pseudorhodoplanes sp.]